MDSDRFLAAIIESCQDCIIGMRPDGVILTWNKAAERIFGLRAEESVGRNITILNDDSQGVDFESVLQMVRKGAIIEHYEINRSNKDGDELLISLCVSPVKSQFGEVLGILFIARDITDARNTRQLVQQIELHKQREDFVAALSHDLKNPIVGCARILELMAQDRVKDPEEARKLIVKMHESHEEVLQIINDMHLVFRYERSTSYTGRDPVDFSELVRRAIKLVEPSAISKGITIEQSIEKGLSTLGEAGPLKRVVSNLLDNAVKFSPEKAQIRLRLSSSASKINLSVTDQGSGIPDDEQTNLFHQFWQGRKGKEYALGSGLGLYLSRQIIEAHEGRILCSSKVNAGTTFVVELNKLDSTGSLCDAVGDVG